MYSSGLPILNLVGAVYCFVSFWVDKYALLRYAVHPPQYDEMLVRRALKMLPYAALMHLALGLWLFANQMVFSSEFPLEGFKQSYEEKFSDEDMEQINKIWWERSDSLEDYKLKILERMYSFPRSASVFHLVSFVCL